jgi:phenylpropionate dioxygenase-like ring-hydroxylating dioxygenase large terminal subunit
VRVHTAFSISRAKASSSCATRRACFSLGAADKAQLSLHPVAVSCWGGFVFVNLTPAGGLHVHHERHDFAPAVSRPERRRADSPQRRTRLPARADFDPSDAVDFWDVVNQQDRRICELVQQGMQSRVHEHGYYAPMEDASLDIRRYIMEKCAILTPS